MPDLGLEVLLKGKNMVRLLGGLWVALRVSLIAVAISIPLGLLLGVLMTRKNIVLRAVLRLYLDTGNAVLKHLPYADSYNTLYAGVIGSPVRKIQIESSIGSVPPDLKRYDSLLKGGDAV